MEIMFLGLSVFVLLFGAILMFIGNRMMKTTIVEKENYTVDNNKKPTIEDANLNQIMVEICKLEGGKVNLPIAQIKEVAKTLNDYAGNDAVYKALRVAWLEKELAKEK